MARVKFFPRFMVILKRWLPVILVVIALAIIPLTWLKPGELDMGGDSNRLYLYDPVSYLKYDGLYYYQGIREGIRTIEPHFFNIPYVTFFIALKSLLRSSYAVLMLFDIVKITVGFLAVYAIIRDLIGENDVRKYLRETSSVLGGLFYILSPGTTSGWNTALSSHDQIFLYPTMLFLFLRYIIKTETRYLWFAIGISVVFSNSFSWVATPPFFAFFPLSVIFGLIYAIGIRKKEIRWKEIIKMGMVFLGLHAFHLIPEIISTFEPGNYLSTRVFDKGSMIEQLSYFHGVVGLSKPVEHLMATVSMKSIEGVSVIFPFIIVLGFLFSKKRDKTYILTGIFFLLSYYLLTARITHIGVKVYEILFYVPGFSMFRNFIGQWAIIYYFFYALLFGQALCIVLHSLGRITAKIAVSVISVVLIFNAWNFINGSIVRTIGFPTKAVAIGIKMDRRYDEVLKFVRTLPKGSSVLSFPFTDCCYQVLHGLGDTVYIGPSTLEFLAGVKDIDGYNNMSPFSEPFLKAVNDHDYNSVKRILAFLNIHYIFYNSDPGVYDSTFPDFPYGYVRSSLPKTQKEYGKLIQQITGSIIFESGPYQIYAVDENFSLPKFYAAKEAVGYLSDPKVASYSKGAFIPVSNTFDLRSVYIEYQDCKKIFPYSSCSDNPLYKEQQIPALRITQINPMKYQIEVSNAKGPYFLVFSQGFYRDWKAYVSDSATSSRSTFKKSIPENRHVVGNAYANTWYILPSDAVGKTNYVITIEMTSQRIFYFSLIVTLVTVVLIILYMNRNKIFRMPSAPHGVAISGERTAEGVRYLLPTFYQHQKVYDYCRTFVKSRRVLDAGCGTGSGAFLLSQTAGEVIAIDANQPAVEMSRKKYKRRNLSFQSVRIGDFEDKNKFDVIVSLQVIEHMEDVHVYLVKIKKLLQSQGTVILSTPNALTQSYNENPYHVHEYTSDELSNLLKKYFRSVTMYGLYGDTSVQKYELDRKNMVTRLLRLDSLRLRNILPRFIVRRLFDVSTVLSRRLIHSESDVTQRISIDNFKIKRLSKEAIDLIAVCR